MTSKILKKSAKITSKSIKKGAKVIRMVYSRSSTPVKAPIQIPVFMLPHNDHLSMIPEESEVRQGFFLRISLKPHKERSFSGLMSLADADNGLVEQSATLAVEFRSFFCFAKGIA